VNSFFTSDSSGTPQLYMIDREGAGKRRVTFEGKYNDSAALSPNGEWLAYATREDVITQIIVMRPGGEDRRVVTDNVVAQLRGPQLGAGRPPPGLHFGQDGRLEAVCVRCGGELVPPADFRE
jgi:hypothetical protein